MQTRTLIGNVVGLTLFAFLLSGCYTRFGVVGRDVDYSEDEAISYEDTYYEDTETVHVIHYYRVPRYFSASYFYYDPYDYWYWEPGVRISFGFYTGPVYYPPYWYPPYGPCPPPYIYGGWYHPPRYGYHYPPPYVVWTPPQTSPNFGRRPKYIAGRERLPVDNGGDRVYSPRSGSGKRTYTTLPKDESGTDARRSGSVERRKKSEDTKRTVYRRPAGSPRKETTVAKPSSSDSQRKVTARPAERTRSGSSEVKSTGSRSSESSGRTAVSRRSSGSGSPAVSRPASDSGSSASRSSSGSSSSSSSDSRRRR